MYIPARGDCCCSKEIESAAAAASPGCPETAPKRNRHGLRRPESPGPRMPRPLAAGRNRPGRKGSLRACTISVGHRDVDQIGLAAGAGPVVVGVAEAMQRCGDQVVEFAQGARCGPLRRHRRGRESAAAWRGFFSSACAGNGAVAAVQAAAQAVAGGHQVHGRGDCRGRPAFTIAAAAARSRPSHFSSALPPSETPAGEQSAHSRHSVQPSQDPVDSSASPEW